MLYEKGKFILFGLIVLILSLLIIVPVKADSGWDSDYGGGSDSGGSSWDSGSSSSSWDYDSSYSGDGSGDIDGVGIVFFIIVVVVIIIVIAASQGNTAKGGTNNSFVKSVRPTGLFKDASAEVLAAAGIDDLVKVKQGIFNTFVAVQNAWMDFDYDKLRELCSDELYNAYKSDLEVLKLKGGKNIMNNFQLVEVNITDAKKVNGTVEIQAYMTVVFNDYVINANSGQVTRGSKTVKVTNSYMMTFIKKDGSAKNAQGEDICPNCGAKLEMNASGKCEYCKADIVKGSDVFVLTKKQKYR